MKETQGGQSCHTKSMRSMEMSQEEIWIKTDHTIPGEESMRRTRETLEMNSSKEDTAVCVDQEHTQQI